MLIRKIIFIMLCMLVPAMAFAQSIGNVVSVAGNAAITRQGKVFIPSTGSDIYSSDTITTDSTGRIRVLFIDNSVINIGPGSSINMERYESSLLKRQVLLSMLKGKARFLISKVSGIFNSYDIRTVTAIIGIRGTDFIIDIPGEDSTKLYVIDGSVNLGNAQQPTTTTILVNAGMWSIVIGGNPPSQPAGYSNQEIQQLLQDTSVPFNDSFTGSYNIIVPPPPPFQGPAYTDMGLLNGLQQPEQVPANGPPNGNPNPNPSPNPSVNIGTNFGNVTK